MPAKMYLRKKAKILCLKDKLWSKFTAFWNIERTVKSTWLNVQGWVYGDPEDNVKKKVRLRHRIFTI